MKVPTKFYDKNTFFQIFQTQTGEYKKVSNENFETAIALGWQEIGGENIEISYEEGKKLGIFHMEERCRSSKINREIDFLLNGDIVPHLEKIFYDLGIATQFLGEEDEETEKLHRLIWDCCDNPKDIFSRFLNGDDVIPLILRNSDEEDLRTSLVEIREEDDLELFFDFL